jgi:hypothetical protein
LVSDLSETHSIVCSVLRPEFDIAFYLANNPNIEEQGLDPVEHYVLQGWKDGLNPNRVFHTQFYLERYPDVAAANINPFYHYLVSGKAEGRVPREDLEEIAAVRSNFDVELYLAQHPDVKKKGLDPVEHYMREGWKSGRNPNRDFNTRFYLESNPDVAAAGVNPFLHYLAAGKDEGRSPHADGWRELPRNIFRNLKTMYIDTKYGYPLKELLSHTQTLEGARATLASGDYDQIRILDSSTNSKDVLVDVGCGQGRIINYWLEKKMNNRIIGIEYDEGIAAATKERLKNYKNVEIICGDATKCTPLDATFIYMFNPFDFNTMQRFADYIWDNRDYYITSNMHILLYNCESADAFDSSRFVQRRISRAGRIQYERAIIRLRDQQPEPFVSAQAQIS